MLNFFVHNNLVILAESLSLFFIGEGSEEVAFDCDFFICHFDSPISRGQAPRRNRFEACKIKGSLHVGRDDKAGGELLKVNIALFNPLF